MTLSIVHILESAGLLSCFSAQEIKSVGSSGKIINMPTNACSRTPNHAEACWLFLPAGLLAAWSGAAEAGRWHSARVSLSHFTGSSQEQWTEGQVVNDGCPYTKNLLAK
jgi:hypothetical protein